MFLYSSWIRSLKNGVERSVIVLHRPHRSGSIINRRGLLRNGFVDIPAESIVFGGPYLAALIDLSQVVEQVIGVARRLRKVTVLVLLCNCHDTTKTVRLR